MRFVMAGGILGLVFAVTNVYFGISAGITANLATTAVLFASLLVVTRQVDEQENLRRRQSLQYSQSLASSGNIAASTAAFTVPVIWLAQYNPGWGPAGMALVALAIAGGGVFAAFIICKAMESAPPDKVRKLKEDMKNAKEPQAILELINTVSGGQARKLIAPMLLAALSGGLAACALGGSTRKLFTVTFAPEAREWGALLVNPAFVALGYLVGLASARGIAIGTLLSMAFGALALAVVFSLPGAGEAIGGGVPMPQNISGEAAVSIGPFIKKVGAILLAIASLIIIAERVVSILRARREYDLRLMSALNSVEALPKEGRRLIIVANIDRALYFRIFDSVGKMVVDIDEKKLTNQAPDLEWLCKKLASLWPPHALTKDEQRQLIPVVTSIVGYTSRRTGGSTVGGAGPPGADRPGEGGGTRWFDFMGVSSTLLVITTVVAIVAVAQHEGVGLGTAIAFAAVALAAGAAACVIAEGVVAVTGVTLNPSSALSLLTGLLVITVLTAWRPEISLPAVMCCAFAAAAASSAAGFAQDAVISFHLAGPPSEDPFFRSQYRGKLLCAVLLVPAAVICLAALLGPVRSSAAAPVHVVLQTFGAQGLAPAGAPAGAAAQDAAAIGVMQSGVLAPDTPFAMPQARALYALLREGDGLGNSVKLAAVIALLVAAVLRMLKASLILTGVGLFISPGVGFSLLVGGMLAGLVEFAGERVSRARPPSQAATWPARALQYTALARARCNASLIVLLDSYFLVTLSLLALPKSWLSDLSNPAVAVAAYSLSVVLLLATILVAFLRLGRKAPAAPEVAR
jgi:hypothetical protein